MVGVFYRSAIYLHNVTVSTLTSSLSKDCKDATTCMIHQLLLTSIQRLSANFVDPPTESSMPPRKRGSEDDVYETVEYKAVYELVREVEGARRYKLVEELAHDVAEKIAANFAVDEVVVRVRKQSVPLGGLIDYTEAEIHRSKT